MSPCEFTRMLAGYNRRESKRQAERDGQLYLLRFMGVRLHNANVDSKSKTIKPQHLFYIPRFDDKGRKLEEMKKEKTKLKNALRNA